MARKAQTDPLWHEYRRQKSSTIPSYTLKVKRNGAIVDITDWTIYFTLKSSITDEDANALIDKKIISHTDPTNGETVITFTASETNLVGNYEYSIDFKDDEDNEGVIQHGIMEFEDNVRKTRD